MGGLPSTCAYLQIFVVPGPCLSSLGAELSSLDALFLQANGILFRTTSPATESKFGNVLLLSRPLTFATHAITSREKLR